MIEFASGSKVKMKMPGKTQRKYVGQLMRFDKSLKTPLHNIKSILPYSYNKYDILNFFKELYPYEWNIIEQRYKQYKAKDDFLIKVGKKIRYKPTPPKFYLFELQKVKHIISEGQKKLHQQNFNEQARLKKLKSLREETKLRMLKINKRIDCATELVQEVEPLYLDIFIQAYHQKGITIEEKMEIAKELQKYECEKSTEFFQKINDSEKNSQIRILAFKHLQSIGKYVKLRKGFKGKKKIYMTEKTNFDMKPLDLLERIENDSIQNKKSFDYFISHSFLDNELVKKIVKEMNKLNLHIYCDWFNDTDFLKRKYASKYTRIILKKRLEQSRKVLFIKTHNTNNESNNFFSKWIKMEILYANKLKKEIEYIDFIGNKKCEFKAFKHNLEIKD